jgi:site-specific recombinase XerD
MEEEENVEPSTDLVIASPALSGEMTVAELVEKARHYVASAKAPETVRGYRIDWKDFSDWCKRHGREAMPASSETVALYLTEEASHHKPATL